MSIIRILYYFVYVYKLVIDEGVFTRPRQCRGDTRRHAPDRYRDPNVKKKKQKLHQPFGFLGMHVEQHNNNTRLIDVTSSCNVRTIHVGTTRILYFILL